MTTKEQRIAWRRIKHATRVKERLIKQIMRHVYRLLAIDSIEALTNKLMMLKTMTAKDELRICKKLWEKYEDNEKRFQKAQADQNSNNNFYFEK